MEAKLSNPRSPRKLQKDGRIARNLAYEKSNKPVKYALPLWTMKKLPIFLLCVGEYSFGILIMKSTYLERIQLIIGRIGRTNY